MEDGCKYLSEIYARSESLSSRGQSHTTKDEHEFKLCGVAEKKENSQGNKTHTFIVLNKSSS